MGIVQTLASVEYRCDKCGNVYHSIAEAGGSYTIAVEVVHAPSRQDDGDLAFWLCGVCGEQIRRFMTR